MIGDGLNREIGDSRCEGDRETVYLGMHNMGLLMFSPIFSSVGNIKIKKSPKFVEVKDEYTVIFAGGEQLVYIALPSDREPLSCIDEELVACFKNYFELPPQHELQILFELPEPEDI